MKKLVQTSFLLFVSLSLLGCDEAEDVVSSTIESFKGSSLDVKNCIDDNNVGLEESALNSLKRLCVEKFEFEFPSKIESLHTYFDNDGKYLILQIGFGNDFKDKIITYVEIVYLNPKTLKEEKTIKGMLWLLPGQVVEFKGYPGFTKGYPNFSFPKPQIKSITVRGVNFED